MCKIKDEMLGIENKTEEKYDDGQGREYDILDCELENPYEIN